MNKKEKIEENSENVKNDKKEDLEKRTTRRLVGDIRTYNTRDQDYARQLLFNLTNIDKNNWTKEQCLQFHKSIIVHYIDDKDDQEMLLAVSGLLDGYKSLMIANKRREKYLKSLPTNHKYAHAQPDSFAKNPEKEKLNYIADKLDEDFNNGKIPLLLQQWIPEPQQSPISELEIGQKPTAKAHKSNIIKCLRALIDDRRKMSFALLAFCIILFFCYISINRNSVDNKFINNNDKNTELEYEQYTSYTMDQIDAGVLSNRIIFNSIVDNPKIDNYGNNDEHNFIVAREADKGELWQTEAIEAENNLSYDDKIYDICVRLKNDNPNGIDAISKETKVFLDMPKYSARIIPVQARIESENARPKTYTSVIYFHGTTDFELEYIKDSARLINNGIGKGNGIKLDDIFNQDGIIIGYSSLNGEIPGGEEYASYIVFKAKAIFNAKDIKYNVDTTVRLVDDSDKSWKKEVDAKIGDKVEFRIEYENTSDARQNNVAIADILPSDLHYVKGTTKLYNDSFPKGALVDSDEVVASGIYVGHYEPGANAIIRFQAEVVDDDFTCGKFILHNWGRASIGEKVMQDSAAVVVQLPYCPDLGVESTTKE